MEDVRGSTAIKSRSKRSLLSFVFMYLVFLLILSAALVLHGYAGSLETALGKLYDRRTEEGRMHESIREMRSTLARAEGLVPAERSTEAAIRYLYAGLDNVKRVLAQGQLGVANPEEKGDEIVLPVAVTGTVTDYQAFLDAIGRLEARRFPFFAVQNLALVEATGNEGQARVAYEIRGTLSTPTSGAGAGGPGSQTGGTGN